MEGSCFLYMPQLHPPQVPHFFQLWRRHWWNSTQIEVAPLPAVPDRPSVSWPHHMDQSWCYYRHLHLTSAGSTPKSWHLALGEVMLSFVFWVGHQTALALKGSHKVRACKEFHSITTKLYLRDSTTTRIHGLAETQQLTSGSGEWFHPKRSVPKP